MIAAIAAGLALGFLGSAHCAVMCGPLATLAAPRASGGGAGGRARLTRQVLLYHAGRILMYVVLGLLVGAGGEAVARAGFGRGLAYAAAAALLVQAWAQWRRGRAATGPATRLLARALGRIGAWMRRHERSGVMLFGGLTGLLPCGLVYGALAAGAGTGSTAHAALLMTAFGVGTSPALLAVVLSAGTVLPRLPLRLRRAAPIALSAIALLLVFRSVHAHEMHQAPAHSCDHGQ